MFATESRRHPLQRAVCMLLAACIVSSILTTGAIGLLALERNVVTELSRHA